MELLLLSAAVGLVELATLFINIIIQIQQLVDLIFANRDLLLASQVYYKGISLKKVIERAFEKYNHIVEKNDAKKEEGKLLSVNNKKLSLEKRFGAGTMENFIKLEDVKEVRGAP